MSEQLTPREEFEQHNGGPISDYYWQWLKEFLAKHTDRAVDFDSNHPVVHFEFKNQYGKTINEWGKHVFRKARENRRFAAFEDWTGEEDRFYRPGETNEDSIRRIVRSELEDLGLIPGADGFVHPPTPEEDPDWKPVEVDRYTKAVFRRPKIRFDDKEATDDEKFDLVGFLQGELPGLLADELERRTMERNKAEFDRASALLESDAREARGNEV